MTTLIAVYNSEGCQGRCDAKCYNAKSPECDCICHGKNHGAGRNQAVQNTRELAESWMKDYVKANNLPVDAKWEVLTHDANQLTLF